MAERLELMAQFVDEKVLFHIMSFLKGLGTPKGAGSVRRHLEHLGYTMAEATVGRLLREMDNENFTEKRSNQGRVLTEKGAACLQEMELKQWQERWAEGFMEPDSATKKANILDLLTARIPVETEVARLAATRATEREIAALRALVEEQEALAQKGEIVTGLDTEFHMELAKASKNSVLEAIVELLRKKQDYALAIETIRKRAGYIYNSEHRKIFEAIEQHDPELAQLTMKRHLDNLAALVANEYK